jgi:hypothetical protein
MTGVARMKGWGTAAAKTAAAVVVLVTLAACATAPAPEPPPSAPATPPPAPILTQPPVDLGGRWKLTAAAGGACFMTLGEAPAATQGTIAPEGGCPGIFYTSRKWTFEHDALIIRNHKAEPLAQLSFTGGHFEGQGTDGAALSLSRPQ